MSRKGGFMASFDACHSRGTGSTSADSEVEQVLASVVQHVAVMGSSGQRGSQAQSSCCGSEHVGDYQCAICLSSTPLCDVAAVKGCEHTYCVTCILQWATSRPDATCPTCKTPFTCLLVHRDVDGSLCDSPISETVSFLARAPWYVNWAREQSQIHELTRQHAAFRSVEAAESERSPLALAQEEWAEEAMYTYFEEEYDDDGMDDFVVTGGSRTTFGNRRWGEGGYVSSGRRRAQPVQPRRGKGSVKGRAQGGAGNGGHKGGPAQSSAGTKQEQQQGRRAQRKAKRAAADRGF